MPWGLAVPDLKGERVGMLAQLLDEALLQPCQGLLVLGGRRERLHVGHKQVLAKGQAQDIQVLPAVAEGAGQRHIDCGSKGVLRRGQEGKQTCAHPECQLQPGNRLPCRSLGGVCLSQGSCGQGGAAPETGVSDAWPGRRRGLTAGWVQSFSTPTAVQGCVQRA